MRSRIAFLYEPLGAFLPISASLPSQTVPLPIAPRRHRQNKYPQRLSETGNGTILCFIQNSQGLGPSCPKGLCCTVLSYRALAELFNLIFWRGKGTGYIHCTADLSENPGWLCPCFTPFPSHFSKASPSAGPALILCLLPHFFRLIPLFCTAPSRAEQHRTAPAEPGVTHRLFAALHRVLGTAAHLSQHLWACGIKGMWA